MLAADEAVLAGREKAVQGRALLQAAGGAVGERWRASTTGRRPACRRHLSGLVEPEELGPHAPGGAAADSAAVRRQGVGRQAAAAAADRAGGDQPSQRAAGLDSARRRGLLQRAAGAGDAARRAGREGRRADAARPRAGALRRGPRQDHRAAGGAGALRQRADARGLGAEHACAAPGAVPGADRRAGRGPGCTAPRIRAGRRRSPTACRRGSRRGWSGTRACWPSAASWPSPAPRSTSTSSAVARRSTSWPATPTRASSGGRRRRSSPTAAARRRIGVQFNVPLYTGGALDSRQRESIAKKRQAEQELSAAQRDARLQVQDAFLAVKTGVSRVAALEQSVLSARTALEATTLGRDVGTRTELDVLDAQQRLFTAQLDLAQARNDYLLGRIRPRRLRPASCRKATCARSTPTWCGDARAAFSRAARASPSCRACRRSSSATRRRKGSSRERRTWR